MSRRVGGAIALCLLTARALQAAPSVVISSPAVPGRTIRVEVDRLPPNLVPILVWNKKHIRSYPIDPDSTRALIGIPLGFKPGNYPLSFIMGTTGQGLLEGMTMTVGERTYPIETVKFPDEKTRMFNESLERKEGARIHKVLCKNAPTNCGKGSLIPVPGAVIGEFGVKRVRNGTIDAGFHKGLDLKAPGGDPVKASNNGVVVLAYPLRIHGKTVIIDHGQGVMSLYLHMQAISVHLGQRVHKGESIGKVGSTGLSTAPHVHWGMYVHGVPIDPAQWTETEF